MKIKTCLLALLLTLCLTTSLVSADLDFGPLLNSDLLISTTAPSGDQAAVAFDGQNYLVVWSQLTEYQEDELALDIYGRLVSKIGLPITEPFPIIAKPANQTQPDVAFNGVNYLVVWHDNHGSASWDTINGRAVSPSGIPLGDEKVISLAQENTRYSPAVASNGADFMVVWQENSNFSSTFSDIHGRQINIDGEGQVIPGEATWTSIRPGQQFNPAIAFGGGRYLVTWSEDETPSANAYDILAVLVNPANMTGDDIIAVSKAPSWQGSRPAGIAFGKGLFLVTFDDHRSGGYYTAVYGARIMKDGVLLDGPPESGGILIAPAAAAGSGNPHGPKTAFANGEWLVAWAGPAVRGARVSVSGEVLDVDGVALSETASHQFAPALASDGNNYLVTWQQDPAFTKYAQLVGYSLSGDVIQVNSTADPGDGICTPIECTLREAILVANRSSGPATIYLPAGTINLAVSGRNEDLGLLGDLDIVDDLTIIGKGDNVTIVDASELDRAFHVFSGTNVILANLTIRNGLAGDGGGILNEGDLDLRHCTITNNHTSYDIPDDLFGTNTAGGILNRGTLKLRRCQITANSTDFYIGDGPGGGILNKGMLTVINSTFSANWAAGGAGIYNDGGFVKITSGNFNNNGVRFWGGAIENKGAGSIIMTRSMIRDNDESIYNEGSLTITSSTITDNRGYRVTGGIQNSGWLYISDSTLAHNYGPLGAISTYGTATLVNTTISHNIAYENYASGIGNGRGTLTLVHCTVANNSGGSAGIHNDADGSTLVQNSIIAGNTDTNCAGVVQSGEYNLDSDGSCGFSNTGDITANPLLGPLQDNGGLTQTHALLPDSPAIDHISKYACKVLVDQRGVTRPIDGDGDGILACDIGAYELNP